MNNWKDSTRLIGRASATYMNDVSIALLGSGFVAEFYMQGLANVNGHKVVANFSRDEARAKNFAKRWSIAQWTTDLGKLIKRAEIDLYIIALPNEAHMPVSLELSSLGEKPGLHEAVGPHPGKKPRPCGRLPDARARCMDMPKPKCSRRVSFGRGR